MIDISENERRQAFIVWLRTGRLPTIRADGTELKFNPYHDPRNGQFTFAPGGPRSLNRVITVHRRRPYVAPRSGEPADRSFPVSEPNLAGASDDHTARGSTPGVIDATRSDPEKALPPTSMLGSARETIARLRADIITLKDAIPTLNEAKGGILLPISDSVFDTAYMLADEADRRADTIFQELSSHLPSFVLERLDPRSFIEDKFERLREIRLMRAAAALRFENDLEPMKLETARLMQHEADKAYDEGDALIRSGKLKIRISRELTLGNYIDSRVREALRFRFGQLEIDTTGKGPVRVNRRETGTSGDERLYRRPDARVGDIAFDVTLTKKTSETPQIRGFFRSDFKPRAVIIIRPNQLAGPTRYAITRPETEK